MVTNVFSVSGLTTAQKRVKVMLDRDELLARLAAFRQEWVNGLTDGDEMSAVTVDLNLFFDDLVNLLGLVDQE